MIIKHIIIVTRKSMRGARALCARARLFAAAPHYAMPFSLCFCCYGARARRAIMPYASLLRAILCPPRRPAFAFLFHDAAFHRGAAAFVLFITMIDILQIRYHAAIFLPFIRLLVAMICWKCLSVLRANVAVIMLPFRGFSITRSSLRAPRIEIKVSLFFFMLYR